MVADDHKIDFMVFSKGRQRDLYQLLLTSSKKSYHWSKSALMSNYIACAIFNRDYLKIAILQTSEISSPTLFKQILKFAKWLFSGAIVIENHTRNRSIHKR